MKKILAILLVLAMIATTAAFADAPADKVGKTVLKCAFNQSITNPEAQTLQAISDALYDATEGRYSLEVYPDASLGDQASTLELCMAGALEMTLVANSIIENYSPDFAIIGTPYVYDSIEHQQKVFESGKLADLFATTEQYGFTVLAAYSLGARNLYTRDNPVTTPEELAGMKIRVMGSDTCVAMMNAMGGVGITMAQGDVYSAIQTKTLDGAENNIITYTDLVQFEVAPYYNYTGHLMIPDELCISNIVLASMSEADQAALKEICAKSITECFGRCADLRASYEAEAASHGVTFSEADVPAFQACCADLIQEVAGRTALTQSVYDAIIECR